MNSFSSLRRLAAPVASAALTALTLAGALWIQHARSAWPFAAAGTTPVITTKAAAINKFMARLILNSDARAVNAAAGPEGPACGDE